MCSLASSSLEHVYSRRLTLGFSTLQFLFTASLILRRLWCFFGVSHSPTLSFFHSFLFLLTFSLFLLIFLLGYISFRKRLEGLQRSNSSYYIYDSTQEMDVEGVILTETCRCSLCGPPKAETKFIELRTCWFSHTRYRPSIGGSPVAAGIHTSLRWNIANQLY